MIANFPVFCESHFLINHVMSPCTPPIGVVLRDSLCSLFSFFAGKLHKLDVTIHSMPTIKCIFVEMNGMQLAMREFEVTLSATCVDCFAQYRLYAVSAKKIITMAITMHA